MCTRKRRLAHLLPLQLLRSALTHSDGTLIPSGPLPCDIVTSPADRGVFNLVQVRGVAAAAAEPPPAAPLHGVAAVACGRLAGGFRARLPYTLPRAPGRRLLHHQAAGAGVRPEPDAGAHQPVQFAKSHTESQRQSLVAGRPVDSSVHC
jgi:hypothetical protein